MAKTTPTIKGAPDLVGADDIARAIGHSRRSVYLWAKKGMPTTRWFGQIAAYSDEVKKWQVERAAKQTAA